MSGCGGECGRAEELHPLLCSSARYAAISNLYHAGIYHFSIQVHHVGHYYYHYFFYVYSGRL